VKLSTLPPERLFGFLHRRRRLDQSGRVRSLPNTPLEAIFNQILTAANEFVPSNAGSILLDDPQTKRADTVANKLVFVACFGDHAGQLVGQEILSDQGIVGRVYRSGQPYLSRDPQRDPYFFEDIDARLEFTTRSILCVPVKIGTAVCGALELINGAGAAAYGQRDLDLLSVFAGYISSSLQNAMDARLAQELARRDDLTGLYNDRFLHFALGSEVEAAVAAGRDVSVVFLDLDWFKEVNDDHGHLVGSRVLREVGELLARTVPAGTMAARYGGDEFVLICPDMDADRAAALAEDVRSVLANAVYLPDTPDTPVPGRSGPVAVGPSASGPVNLRGAVTASCGVASLRALGLHAHPDPATRQTALLRAADAAMYRAKALGKNQVVRATAADLASRSRRAVPAAGA
jgi:diguanylate cyclase (GGDEF)-like protein